MDIQNIKALAEQLQNLGFGDLCHLLAKRICLRRPNFTIQWLKSQSESRIVCCLFFERDGSTENYKLTYYDAVLQPHERFEHVTDNGVSAAQLNDRMATIDWKAVFDDSDDANWNASTEADWLLHIEVDAVMGDLEKLQNSATGMSVATALMLKHWNGTGYERLFPIPPAPKNKAEVSQRFYFNNKQSSIAVDEAIRFLQNRVVERQMQARRKPLIKQPVDEDRMTQSDGSRQTRKHGSGNSKRRDKIKGS